jgi:hypothetical protein
MFADRPPDMAKLHAAGEKILAEMPTGDAPDEIDESIQHQ